MQPSNLNDQAKENIERAFKKTGCSRKVSSREYGFDTAYTGSLTSVICPNEVLLLTPQPHTSQAYDDLYAMAGHEAIHTQHHHALKAEATFFFSYELCQEMMRRIFVTTMAKRFATLASLSIAFFMYSQVSQQLEYQADRESAERLGTQKTLCRLFHETPSVADPLHPSSASREARITHN